MYLFGAVGGAPRRPDDDHCVCLRPVLRVAEEPLVDRRHRRDGAVVRQVLLVAVVVSISVVFLCHGLECTRGQWPFRPASARPIFLYFGLKMLHFEFASEFLDFTS